MSLDVNDAGVQTYLTILQGVINRLASNSASAKTWCVTLVSAILVFAVDKSHPEAVDVAFLPLALFFLIDVYYLSLERDIRNIYRGFVGKLHAQSAQETDLYAITVTTRGSGRIVAMGIAAGSTSVWVFYVFFALSIWALKAIILR